jgi:hypothetical protein
MLEGLHLPLIRLVYYLILSGFFQAFHVVDTHNSLQMIVQCALVDCLVKVDWFPVLTAQILNQKFGTFIEDLDKVW